MLIMTSLDDAIETTQTKNESELNNVQPEIENETLNNILSEIEDTRSNHSLKSTSSYEQYFCQKCEKDYFDQSEFLDHIRTHVQQPKIVLQRIDHKKKTKCGPLKFTVRTSNNKFQIIKSQNNEEQLNESNFPRIPKLRILLPDQLSEQFDEKEKLNLERRTETLNNLLKSSSDSTLETICNGILNQNRKMVELHSLPNESQSPSFPIRSPSQPDNVNITEHNSFWNHQPTEDPLALGQSGEKEAETHNNLLQNFLNDTLTVKEQPISSNENEYISLERLAEKNSPTCPICNERCLDQKSLDIHQKAMGHYLTSSSLTSRSSNSLVPYGQPSLANALASNPLDSLANLPMTQLAQQVNRLQQGGVHQQNVLINIQQFGQPMGQPMAPPQYGRPPDIPHYPGPGQYYPGQQQAPHMYGGYHPQMNHPSYYPSSSGMYPPMSHNPQSQHSQQSMQHAYVPSQPPQPPPQPRMMPPRAPPPQMVQQQQQQQQQQQRMAPPQQNQMRPRTRMPMQRASGPRTMGPRSAAANNNMPRPNMPQQVRPQRRQAPPQNHQDVKRKRMDLLIPDTNDNDECSVISVQKCNDGLPVIKNVQGATSGHSEADPIVHLTDSITLSVRNPKEQQQPVVPQKKSDAKAVANILATRGITVTPAAKTQSSNGESQKSNSPPVQINLNSAVSIIPTAKQQQNNSPKENSPNRSPRPPTVDLTDDDPVQKSQSAATVTKRTLPHHCDLCPAQYPTLQSLMQHRKSYHKIVGQNELGVPVIDLKQSVVLSKLASIGIHSYIPLPQLGNGSGNFALPIVSVNAAKNPNICNLSALGSGAVLPLGPLRHLQNNSNPKQ